MQVSQQKEVVRFSYPTIVERKLPFKNLERIPFKVFVKGSTLEGTITPIGEVLSNGMPSAFQVRMRGKKMSLIACDNGVWSMPAHEDLVFELGVWIELHYQ